MRATASALAVALSFALACGGLPNTGAGVQSISAKATSCGWEATIQARGSGQTLTLEAEGVQVGQWQVQGDQQFTANGLGDGFVTLTATLDGDVEITSVQTAPPRAALVVEPGLPELHAGEATTVTLVARSPCVMPLLDWRASMPDVGFEASGVIVSGEQAQLRLPALGQGDSQLQLELSRLGDVIDTRSLPVHVGPKCGDNDGDGVSNCAGDCDDTRAAVHPGAKDIVGDGLDNDCDGVNGADNDRDGHEDAARGGDDCDDNDPSRHPGAAEGVDRDGDGYFAPNGIDDDCDGKIDERVGDPIDCDDLHAGAHPGADELATPNQIDDNCDGRVDEGTIAYDDDGDGLSELEGDCDDTDPRRHPGATELPDCRDQDCDDEIDEGVDLPQVDDRNEPNDTRAQAKDLQTYDKRSFSQDLQIISRGAADQEWFAFFSHDGTWDDWGIDITVTQMPESGGSYLLEVRRDGGGLAASSVVRSEGGSVSVRGRGFRDDTGRFLLSVVPQGIHPWCPATIHVVSR